VVARLCDAVNAYVDIVARRQFWVLEDMAIDDAEFS
jgi:hypothetical protein